ncbi:MAG: tryptophan synthase subunit alpha [Chloroflexi bacterium]|nr:tryptophan synthase subunit alpha [Chloroflexota bacterium]
MSNQQSEIYNQQSLARISNLFGNSHAALMPYFPLGFPDAATSLDVIVAMSEAGADAFELGLSFSDPLADGPVIQHATQIALEQGITVAKALAMIAELRARGVKQPFLLMGYFNPMLAYGLERFVNDAAVAGVDGFIVPDLPPEEADDLDRLCADRGLGLIYFLAPTSTDERLKLVAAKARGFIYLVSLTGVTGTRSKLADNLGTFVDRVRHATTTPIAIGFGVSTPEQAADVSRLADGVIVGSRLVQIVDRAEDKAQAAAQFVRALKSAMR